MTTRRKPTHAPRSVRISAPLVAVAALTATGIAGSPSAIGAGEPLAVSAARAAGLPLPRGIHRTSHGRFTRDMCDHSRRIHCLSQVLLPAGWTPGDPVPQGAQGGSGAASMSPSDIAAAYGIPSAAASGGKIVAIVDEPDSHAYADLTAYRSAYSLPALPHCAAGTTPVPGGSPCFAQVSETGGASSGDSGTADGETSVDMDMVSAACPDCSILLVDLAQDFETPVSTAARLGAVAISVSFGGPETGADANDFTTSGHLVLAASGDYAYDNINMGKTATPSYPSSAPSVLSVGGTALYYNGGASYDEAVWNDGVFSTTSTGQDVTTSGCSTEFAVPAWQAAGLAGTGCNMRATADLAAAATFFSGGEETAIASYDSAEGGMVAVFGTSASSPMMAALFTRLGLAEKIADSLATGGTNWVYDNPSGFRDLGSPSYPVHTGGPTSDAKDPSTCGKLCSVATGWDGPSGMGTPNGAALAALAAGTTPPGSGSGSSSAATSSVASSAGPGSGRGTSSGGVMSSGLPLRTGSTSGGASAAAASSGAGAGAGASCTASTDCASGLCGARDATSSPVCTAACGAASDCPAGLECPGGYCFASSGTIGEGEAPSGGEGTSGTGGCSTSGAGRTAGLGLLGAMAWLAALGTRRRSARR